MKHAPIEARAREFMDALHALESGSEAEAAPLAALYAADAVLTNAALDLAGKEIKGHEAILRFWVEYKETFGEIRSQFHHVTTSGHAAGLFWTTEGQTAEGESIRYHGATLLEWNDEGKIVFFRGYYDTRELTVGKEA